MSESLSTRSFAAALQINRSFKKSIINSDWTKATHIQQGLALLDNKQKKKQEMLANRLECRGNYSATSNAMKLIH